MTVNNQFFLKIDNVLAFPMVLMFSGHCGNEIFVGKYVQNVLHCL